MGSLFSSSEPTQEEEPVASSMASSEMGHTLQPKKLRNPRVTILKEIIRNEITLNEDLEKENNAILTKFLITFIGTMKQVDEIFRLLYNRIYYTGSYFSDLRIAAPDEFDLNIVLKLPFKASSLEMEFKKNVPSYVKYQLKNGGTEASEHARLKRLFFVDNYVIPEKVRNWLQSVVDKALKTAFIPNGCVAVKAKAAGPARTMQLVKRGGGIIDIDFVPVLESTLPKKPPGIDSRVNRLMGDPVKCFLVPKPYKPSTEAVFLSSTECLQLWRLHFPDIENTFIHHKGCVKPIVKLLKLLRDKCDWKILASYYLKTVVMWHLLENPSEEYWQEDKMGDRFEDVLEKLYDCVSKKNIPYYFSTPYNLISKINDAHAYNLENSLKSILKRIKRDPTELWKVFQVIPTFKL